MQQRFCMPLEHCCIIVGLRFAVWPSQASSFGQLGSHLVVAFRCRLSFDSQGSRPVAVPHFRQARNSFLNKPICVLFWFLALRGVFIFSFRQITSQFQTEGSQELRACRRCSASGCCWSTGMAAWVWVHGLLLDRFRHQVLGSSVAIQRLPSDAAQALRTKV
jgi:hypothetical protein